MTLVALSGSSRPFQSGHAVGTSGGLPHMEPVDWLIDTGADWSAVLPSLAQSFTTTNPVNANTAPPAGQAYRLAAGIDIRFTVLANHVSVTTTSRTPLIAIKATNVGSNLIGIPELVTEDVEVRWHAKRQAGELRR